MRGNEDSLCSAAVLPAHDSISSGFRSAPLGVAAMEEPAPEKLPVRERREEEALSMADKPRVCYQSQLQLGGARILFIPQPVCRSGENSREQFEVHNMIW